MSPSIDLEHPLADLPALIERKSSVFQLKVVSIREADAGHAACLSLVMFGPDGAPADANEQEVWVVPKKHLGSKRLWAYLQGWANTVPQLVSHWAAQLGYAPLAMYFTCPALLEDLKLVSVADFQQAFESVMGDTPHPLYAKYLKHLQGDDVSEDFGENFDHRKVASAENALYVEGAQYERFRHLKVGIEKRARSGLFSLQHLFDDLAGGLSFEKDAPEDLARSLQEIAKAALAALSDAELEYPETTMNDRLERAFAQLERNGILVGEATGYTQKDCASDLAYRVEDDTRGYVFYTEPDLERAVDGSGLRLAFGAQSSDPDAPRVIAKEVIATLAEHGVPVSWAGTAEHRIEIAKFTWQKRRANRVSNN